MTTNSLVRCRVCNRPLRNPMSRALGAGPTCASGQTRGRSLRVQPNSRPSSSDRATDPSRLSCPVQGEVQGPVVTRQSFLPAFGQGEDELIGLITTPYNLLEYRARVAKLKRGARKTLREMRARMIEGRQRFCAGMFLLTGEQCEYVPVDGDRWYEAHHPDRSYDAAFVKQYLARVGTVEVAMLK
jgi:Family of unknown function (DUF6011)